MGLLSFFGFGKRKKLVKEYLSREAQIIDVRMTGEFKTGHIDGAINIPLELIDEKVNQVTNLNKPVVLCCVSGMRSSVAARKLRKAGVEAVNGGSWYGLKMIVDHQEE
jgi:phage shock protein E